MLCVMFHCFIVDLMIDPSAISQMGVSKVPFMFGPFFQRRDSMKDRLIICLAALVLIGVASVPTYAALTGTITGKIDDNTGNPIPGVTVTLTSTAIQGEKQDFTNENGEFRFPDLPPGSYEVKAEMMGLQTVEKKDVQVKINATARVPMVMQVATVETTVVVTAEAIAVDTTSTTQSVNIERKFTDKLAGGGSYQDSMTMVGGIVGGSNPQVRGGSKMDNVYLLDGVDTTDTLTGTFASNINPDALEEVEVQTGGFQAEYGRALGGIVNAVTKSGGNDFNFIFRLEYYNNTWEENSFYSNTDSPKREIWTPTLSIGGPIVKDMLWFFITARYANIDDSAKVIRDTNDDPANPQGEVDTSDEGLYPYAKLTFQPTAAHKFVAKYNAEIRTIYGYDAAAATTPEATADWEQGGPFYGIDWTWLFSQNTYLTTQFAYHHGFLNHFPKDEDLSNVGYTDTEDGISWGAPSAYQYEDRDRTDFGIALSHYLDEWIRGSHDLKLGLEFQDLLVREEDGIPGNEYYTYNAYQSGWDEEHWGKDYYYDQKRIQTSGEEIEYTGQYIALYGQDGWEIQDGMTFNFGIRAENMKFENDTGRVKSETFNTSSKTMKTSYQDDAGKFTMVAPRLGLAWDVNNTGKDKLSFYLGRYYKPLDLQLPGMLNEGSPVYQEYRRRLAEGADRRDYNNRNYSDADWFMYQQTGGEENTNSLDPNLKPEYSDEVSFGYERELFTNVTLGTTLTYRKTRDIIEDAGVWYEYNGDQPTGNVLLAWELPDDYQDRPDGTRWEQDHYYITNPPDARRNYFGAELNGKVRTQRLTVLAAYTYAVTKGTVYGDQPVGAGGYSGSRTVSHFSVYYDTLELSKNLYGKLPYDIDHYFKINASYDFFPETWYAYSLGVSYFYRNGYAYSRRTTDPVYAGAYSVEKYGAGTYRLPAISSCDVSLQKHFPFAAGKYGTLSVIFDITNLFSNEYLLSRAAEDKEEKRPWAFDANGGHGSPRTYQLSFKYEI